MDKQIPSQTAALTKQIEQIYPHLIKDLPPSYTTSLRASPYSPRSVTIDLDTLTTLSQISVWDTGECDVFIKNDINDLSNNITTTHHTIKSVAEFKKLFCTLPGADQQETAPS